MEIFECGVARILKSSTTPYAHLASLSMLKLDSETENRIKPINHLSQKKPVIFINEHIYMEIGFERELYYCSDRYEARPEHDWGRAGVSLDHDW